MNFKFCNQIHERRTTSWPAWDPLLVRDCRPWCWHESQLEQGHSDNSTTLKIPIMLCEDMKQESAWSASRWVIGFVSTRVVGSFALALQYYWSTGSGSGSWQAWEWTTNLQVRTYVLQDTKLRTRKLTTPLWRSCDLGGSSGFHLISGWRCCRCLSLQHLATSWPFLSIRHSSYIHRQTARGIQQSTNLSQDRTSSE